MTHVLGLLRRDVDHYLHMVAALCFGTNENVTCETHMHHMPVTILLQSHVRHVSEITVCCCSNRQNLASLQKVPAGTGFLTISVLRRQPTLFMICLA